VGGGQRGRPPVVSAGQLREAAWALFERDGYAATSTAVIAGAAGVSARTFFRYFAGKPGLVWADFDAEISGLRRGLATAGPGASLPGAIRDAVAAASGSAGREPGRQRLFIELVTREPALLAAASGPHARWRSVIAGYAARRLGTSPSQEAPVILAYRALAAWQAGCDLWLDGGGDLAGLVARAFTAPGCPG
jgi:TetR/AcrR family transcriptional regulator, regulator of mycofactocin system